MFYKILSNLFSYSFTIFEKSSLVNFFNALSDTAIANPRSHFKKSPLQLKNLKTNQNTSVCYAYKKASKHFKKEQANINYLGSLIQINFKSKQAKTSFISKVD